MDQTGFANPLTDAFYAHVAPRICTNPLVAERMLSALLDVEVSGNDLQGETPYEKMTPFHALEAPSINVGDYVRRISQYAFSSTACLLAAFHYVKRAVKADKALAPTSLSVHRLLITAVVLAAKYFDDITYSMGYYAKVGGLPVKELAYLELQMLNKLEFRLHISPADFHTLEQDLIANLTYVPHTPLSSDARGALQKAKIHSQRHNFCEAMHDSDQIGLWRPHPNPEKPMLISMESDSSPVSSRASSPRNDDDDLDDVEVDELRDGAQYYASCALLKQCSNVSAASGGSPGCTPRIRPHHAPPMTVSRRTYCESSAAAGATTRCATALEWGTSPPTPDTRTHYEGTFAAAYRDNLEAQAQDHFEESVRYVNEGQFMAR